MFRTLERSLIVSQTHRGNVARFFNTARDGRKNNAVAVRRVYRGRVRIFIVLLEDVKEGDEITIPYGPNFDIDSFHHDDDDDDDE